MSAGILTTAVLVITETVSLGATRTEISPSPTPPIAPPAISVIGGTAGVSAGNDQVTVTAGSSGGDSPTPTPSATVTTTCTSTTVDGSTAAALISSDPTITVTQNGPAGFSGPWLYILCPGGTPSLVETGPGVPAAPASPTVLAEEAESAIRLPTMTMRMSPAQATIISPFETWLAVDPGQWRALSATASAGGVRATATAAPDRVDWDMGDGHGVSCAGPGQLWNPGLPAAQQATDCSYRYPRPSGTQPGQRYAVRATVHWHVTWTVTGAAGGGDLGDVNGAPSTTSLEVDEIQVVTR